MMTQTQKTACIFGGTGFVGTQIVQSLTRAGYRVKVATRVPERAYFLKPCGSVGQVVPVACDGSAAQIAAAVQGCDVVVNCIGILFEKKKNRFQTIHVEIPRRIAEACQAHQVKRFVHISALGIEESQSHYAQTKRAGEEAVLQAFPSVTILRPSIIFGAEDNFFNQFAQMAMVLPFLPLIGGGKTRFQPVYVCDVAAAVMAALSRPDSAGQTYALGGPDIYSFAEIYDKIAAITGREVTTLSLSFGGAKIMGCVMGLLPHPPLTADQVESLKTDSVVPQHMKTLGDLGIVPQAVDVIVPDYLRVYKAGGRFADKKTA